MSVCRIRIRNCDRDCVRKCKLWSKWPLIPRHYPINLQARVDSLVYILALSSSEFLAEDQGHL